MKLLSLNTWGGNLFDPLIEFLKKYRDTVDIFSLQEIWSTPTGRTVHADTRPNLLQEIERALHDHVGYFSITQEGIGHGGPVDFELATGNAMFIRKDINVSM